MSVDPQYRQLQRPVNLLKSTDILNTVNRFLIFVLSGNEVLKKETLQSAQSKQSLLIGNHTTTSSVAASQDIPVTQNHAAHLQTYAAKAILSRMSRGAGTGGDSSDMHRLPMIASALVSVGLDSSAHVVRHLAPEVGGHLPPDSNSSSPSSTLNKHSTLNPHQQSSASDVYGSSRSHAKNGGVGDESTIGTPPVDTNRFSQLLTPTIIDDHFDQYKTYSRQTTSASNYSSSSRVDSQPTNSRPRNLLTSTATDSKAEGPMLPEFSYDRPTPQWRPTNDTSPDSGVSVGDDTRGPSRGGLSLLQRRQTLPGGPAYATTISPPSRGSGTSERPKENGILPGLSPMSSIGAPSSGPMGPSTASVRPTPLHIPAVAMFRSTLRKTPNMGSMPDVTTEPVTSSTMPREEVHLLSLRRREEIRREREEQERRRQQEIVLRFGDIKVFYKPFYVIK